MEKPTSRRAFLLKCIQVPVGGTVLLGLTACEGDSASSLVCADENVMTSAEKSLRRTLQYAEASPFPGKTCNKCEFFKGTTGCGTCEMFGGKPVNPGGHCVSWSVDPKGAA